MDERAEIEWQSYQQDLAVEAAVKAERERVLEAIEHCLRNPIAYPENMSGLIARLRKGTP